MFEYGGGFVQDRSVYEDVDIFAKMHEEQGTMSPEDFHTYSELFNAMVMTPYFPKPDVLIYLECDYDEVIDRISNVVVIWKLIQTLNIGKIIQTLR